MSMEKEPSYWGAGWATFAGLMMIMLGIFHAISGLAEVVDPDAYVVSRELRASSSRATRGDGST